MRARPEPPIEWPRRSRALLWVCESCGDVWYQLRGERPARDHDGRVLCESCRTFAGIDPSERRP